MEEYISVSRPSCTEITEKKSKFIANIAHAETEQAAEAFIAGVKKEHYNATHNVFAYRLFDGAKKYSDDGEPAKTAGYPILELLEKERICDTVCVVTRYFGGTLLGVGGLIRAYTRAAKEGLLKSGVSQKTLCQVLQISVDYTCFDQLMHILKASRHQVLQTEYLEAVTLTVVLELETADALAETLSDAFFGAVRIEKKEQIYFDLEGDV